MSSEIAEEAYDYREDPANGELPDVYAGTPYDLALLPF